MSNNQRNLQVTPSLKKQSSRVGSVFNFQEGSRSLVSNTSNLATYIQLQIARGSSNQPPNPQLQNHHSPAVSHASLRGSIFSSQNPGGENQTQQPKYQLLDQQMLHKHSFMAKGLNTFNAGTPFAGQPQNGMQNQGRTARSSLERVLGIGGANYQPVYMENKQFFKDLTSKPVVSERKKVSKEVINESVYGRKWKEKLIKTIVKQESKDSEARMPDISESIQKPKKRKLNKLNSLYLSSDEEDNNQFVRNYASVMTEKASQKDQSFSMFNSSVKNSTLKSALNKLKNNRQQRFNDTSNLEIQHQEYEIGVNLSDGQDDENFVNKIGNTPKSVLQNKKHFTFQKRIGEQAIYDFYNNFKNIKKSIEREEHLKFPQSSYINRCEEQKLVPRPYGLVKYKGTEEEINVENYSMGDNYALAYGKGLQLIHAKKINLSNNRLMEKGSYNILQGLNKSVQEIDLSYNKLGINSIGYLGKLFQSGDGFNLRVIKIEHSCITDSQLTTLLNSLIKVEKSQLVELNLARNLITDIGADKIAEYLLNENSQLRVLNLHWNQIKLKGGLKIADAIQKNHILKILDLSWNSLGVQSDPFFGQMTISQIKKKLKGQAVQNYQDAVAIITEKEILQKEQDVGRIWGNALKHNITLIHLDLSYNNFGNESCKIIAQKIKRNHSIYGLHMAGNSCNVDSHGFVHIEENNPNQQSLLTPSSPKKQTIGDKKISRLDTARVQSRQGVRQRLNLSQIMKSPQKEVLFKRMEGMKAVIKKRQLSVQQSPSRAESTPKMISKTQQLTKQKTIQIQATQSISEISQNAGSNPCSQLQKFKIKDNCWICEGWSEFKFEIRTSLIGAEVYLHFDFDDYKPDLMISSSAGVYQVFRMIPPGIHHYFFSVNGQYNINTIQQQLIIDGNYQEQISQKLQQNFERAKSEFNLLRVNFVESQQQESWVNPERYEVTIKNCLPRPFKMFAAQTEERPRTPWTIVVSIFKDYKSETPLLVNDCFEFDWQCLKKLKLKKSTDDELKEASRQIYPFIREAYKRLAAIGIVGTVFSIGWNVFREFIIQTLNFSDKDKLKPDDCDRLFIGVNANQQKKSPFIPEKALVRFQLLEVLIKAAIKRYFESGDVETEVEAIEQLNRNFLIPYKESTVLTDPYIYDQHRWRIERYWNEACDNIFKAFAPLFTYLYNTYGGTHKKPGQKTFMTLDEFDLLIQNAGLLNDLLNSRDIPVCFNQAMMLQINEIDQERHLQAVYLEFLEAYARACDQASLIQTESTNNLDNLDQNYLMSEEERQSLPLHVKIENSIPYLLRGCTNKAFMDKFEMPKKHPVVGLYILPNKKFF